jgi:hypothetical protein
MLQNRQVFLSEEERSIPIPLPLQESSWHYGWFRAWTPGGTIDDITCRCHRERRKSDLKWNNNMNHGNKLLHIASGLYFWIVLLKTFAHSLRRVLFASNWLFGTWFRVSVLENYLCHTSNQILALGRWPLYTCIAARNSLYACIAEHNSLCTCIAACNSLYTCIAVHNSLNTCTAEHNSLYTCIACCPASSPSDLERTLISG